VAKLDAVLSPLIEADWHGVSRVEELESAAQSFADWLVDCVSDEGGPDELYGTTCRQALPGVSWMGTHATGAEMVNVAVHICVEHMPKIALR
jgi:hypothetical protein